MRLHVLMIVCVAIVMSPSIHAADNDEIKNFLVDSSELSKLSPELPSPELPGLNRPLRGYGSTEFSRVV